MPRFEDLNELKNDTQRMTAIRERLSHIIYDKMCEEFGAEWSRYIPEKIGITENASEVPKNTVVVDVGDVKDKDNFDVGVCVEITVKVKKWNDVVTKSNKTQYGVSLDDYDIALKRHEEKEG